MTIASAIVRIVFLLQSGSECPGRRRSIAQRNPDKPCVLSPYRPSARQHARVQDAPVDTPVKTNPIPGDRESFGTLLPLRRLFASAGRLVHADRWARIPLPLHMGSPPATTAWLDLGGRAAVR